MLNVIQGPAIDALTGHSGLAWNVLEQRMLPSITTYVPFGCPDWGAPGGIRDPRKCVFCALPDAPKVYEKEFNEGKKLTVEEMVQLFMAVVVQKALPLAPSILKIFNAGSFLAMPEKIQEEMMETVVSKLPSVRYVVIEARAILITDERVRPLTNILMKGGKKLQILIGIETQDDKLRNHELGKGHSRRALYAAKDAMLRNGVSSGAYVLLKPALSRDVRWLQQEAQDSIIWMLEKKEGGLELDEVQFNPTCVAPGTKLFDSWVSGSFQPPSLRSIVGVLGRVVGRFPGKVVLGRFVDEPAFVAVPSNHVPQGIDEALTQAQGCDLSFHRFLDAYRKKMDPAVLSVVPACTCQPTW